MFFVFLFDHNKERYLQIRRDRFFLGTAILIIVKFMFKKFQFPMNIFMVFEKVSPIVYTSSVLTPNHYVCFVTAKNYNQINYFLKNELFYNFSMLSEISAIDTSNFSDIIPDIDCFFEKNRFLKYSIYYFYTTKIRLTLVTSLENACKEVSIDNLYTNANWLERELSEMFGVTQKLKNDQRILLLDYSKDESPMIKEFPTEGYKDVYYSFFENQLIYLNNEFVEL